MDANFSLVKRFDWRYVFGMIAPWRRIMIAMARGVLLKPSGTMKWIANVTVFSTTPLTGQQFNLIDFAADSEIDAARFAAEASAKRVYGNEGSVSFVNQTNGPLYMATIGFYDGHGITRGRSVEILIRRYEHPVTGEMR